MEEFGILTLAIFFAAIFPPIQDYKLNLADNPANHYNQSCQYQSLIWYIFTV